MRIYVRPGGGDRGGIKQVIAASLDEEQRGLAVAYATVVLMQLEATSGQDGQSSWNLTHNLNHVQYSFTPLLQRLKVVIENDTLLFHLLQ